MRDGQNLGSAQIPERLAICSRVEELEIARDRLHYRLLSGSGPPQGWVSIRLKDKALLEPCKEQLGTTTQPPPLAAATSPWEPPKVAAESDYKRRVARLQEQYPGLSDHVLPAGASTWAPRDLEHYFESGGMMEPTGGTSSVFLYRPARDAQVPGYPLQLVEDDEGDRAHEFFVEDLETGEMRSCLVSVHLTL